jgi:hypothetical protein
VIHETFPADGVTDIDVSVPSGSIVVDEDTSGSIEIRIDSRRDDEWRVTRAGSTIRVHTERNSWLGGGRADVRVRLPRGIDARITTASADVRSLVPLGRVSVSTASGDVELTSTDTATVATASGDVRLGDVAGALGVKSASGDVVVGEVGGDVTIKSASGEAFIRSAAGAIAVSSASGDIRVDRYLGSDLELNTMSGDILFGLPAGTAVRLQASTLSGSVVLPDKRPPSSSSPSSTPVDAKAKSVSGDIRVLRV